MSGFRNTAHWRAATKLLDDVAEHLCDAWGVPRSAENAVRPIQSEPSEGFAPYTRGGATVDVDIPLSTFVDDFRLMEKASVLPEPVREAILRHAEVTQRHRLEVACASDPGASAAVEGWDWSAGLPLDLLHEAGFDDLVNEADSEAATDLDCETLRFTMHAMHRHGMRDALLSLVLTANTEFEYHRTEGALRRDDGPRPEGEPSVDHVILDKDFTEAHDLSDATFTGLLTVIQQTLPAPEAPSYSMGR